MTSLLLTLLMTVAVGEPGKATASLLDGRTASGRLEGWDAKRIAVATDDGRQEFATTELLRVRWPSTEPPTDTAEEAVDNKPTTVELIDGTRIAATELTVADRVATVATPYAPEPLEIPTSMIRRVQMQPPSAAAAKAWQEMEEKQPAGDVLMVAQRDGESVDYLTGVIGDVTAEQVSFEWDGERVEVKRTKVAAVAFYRAEEATLPEAVCELHLADGSRISVREVELKDDRVTITTPADVSLKLALAELREVDFSAGKLVYLSDLTLSVASWTPRIAAPAGAQLVGAHGLPRRDVSFTGSPLSLLWDDDPLPSRRDVRPYSKGLALRSRTELTYRLPANMRRFVAIAGIDPATVAQGHVTLEIRGDDQVLWQGEIDGRQPPVAIDVELGSARRLHLRVDYGENLDYGDRLHLAEARVTK